jgi:hypothetical protein
MAERIGKGWQLATLTLGSRLAFGRGPTMDRIELYYCLSLIWLALSAAGFTYVLVQKAVVLLDSPA